jgi:hypothetical protein
MDRQFTRTTFLIVSGLTIWLADFMLIYVGAAVLCARGGGSMRILGAPAIASLALGVSVLAAAATLIVARRAWRQARMATDDREQFTFFQTAALSGLALIAIAWTAAPALLLPPGCS